MKVFLIGKSYAIEKSVSVLRGIFGEELLLNVDGNYEARVSNTLHKRGYHAPSICVRKLTGVGL